jgi:hypothetical protein
MPDDLAKAIADMNAVIQQAPLPPTWKWAAGFGAGIVTNVSDWRERQRRDREAELRAYGIPFTDPYSWDASKRLESAKGYAAMKAEGERLAAVRGRLDALDAQKPKEKGFVVPRSGVAWEGDRHPNDSAPGPRPGGGQDVGG